MLRTTLVQKLDIHQPIIRTMTDPNGPRQTPQIRLNSGSHDPFTDVDDPYVSAPSPQIGRALTSDISHSPSSGTMRTVYSSNFPQESTEFLIPPQSLRPREEYSASLHSPERPVPLSRQTSWTSDGGSYDARGYASIPFEDSRAPSREGSEENDVNTQTVAGKYNITPTEGLLLFPEDVEKDDAMHNPDPEDHEQECDIWNRRGIINVGGLILLTVGFLVLFIGYPVMYGASHKKN